MTKHQQRKTRQIIQSFEAKAHKKSSFSDKIADKLTSHFGSFGFLIVNLVVFASWIIINKGLVPGVPIFDPYPFVLLITIVSLEAIILTTIILMSENREKQIGTLRDEMQLQVELITEKEISKVLQILKLIINNQGIKYTDEDLEEMIKEVDTSYIERKLHDQLSPKQKSVKEKVVETAEKISSSNHT